MRNPAILTGRLMSFGGILAACALSARADLTTNLTPVAHSGQFQRNPVNNLGGNPYVIAGTIGIGEKSRALFSFDVASALPDNATATSASLALVVPIARRIGRTFELRRVLQDWGEGTGADGGGTSGLLPANRNPQPAQRLCGSGSARGNDSRHDGRLWSRKPPS